MNGKSLAAYPYVTDMTVCVPEKTVKGARTIMFTQGEGAVHDLTVAMMPLTHDCWHVHLRVTTAAVMLRDCGAKPGVVPPPPPTPPHPTPPLQASCLMPAQAPPAAPQSPS